MARARNIKPSFFQNDALGELSPLARLLFIGMWTIADYRGCLEFRPKRVKAQLLPYDDDADIDALAAALDKSGFVTIYSVSGQSYVKITNFEKHQNPHPNEKKSGSDLPDVDHPDAQVVVLKGQIASNVSLVINHDQDGTDPADSPFPHPSSLIPPDDASAPGGVERRAGNLAKIEDILPAGPASLPGPPVPPVPPPPAPPAVPAPPKPPKADDAAFEQAWALYPKRDGGNPRKDALSAWNARIKEGVPAEDMIAGLQRYAAHLKARGKIGTPYVMQGSTFFGPSARYAETWAVGAPPAASGPANSKFHGLNELDHSGAAALHAASMKRMGIEQKPIDPNDPIDF